MDKQIMQSLSHTLAELNNTVSKAVEQLNNEIDTTLNDIKQLALQLKGHKQDLNEIVTLVENHSVVMEGISDMACRGIDKADDILLYIDDIEKVPSSNDKPVVCCANCGMVIDNPEEAPQDDCDNYFCDEQCKDDYQSITYCQDCGAVIDLKKDSFEKDEYENYFCNDTCKKNYEELFNEEENDEDCEEEEDE